MVEGWMVRHDGVELGLRRRVLSVTGLQVLGVEEEEKKKANGQQGCWTMAGGRADRTLGLRTTPTKISLTESSYITQKGQY
jgi:hypothetical protein